MKSKIRHDLRHPLATISMIASAVAAFGDGVGHEAIEIYRSQVVVELDEFTRLAEDHKVKLGLEELVGLVGRFSAEPTSEIAKSLDEACSDLLSRLSEVGFDGS